MWSYGGGGGRGRELKICIEIKTSDTAPLNSSFASGRTTKSWN